MVKPQSKEAPSVPAPPPPSGEKPAGAPFLSVQQKYALVAGAAVLVLILGAALYTSGGWAAPSDADTFSNYLYGNNRSGILMDVRDAPDAAAAQKVMQCGVNLISSGFYAKTRKDLLVFACNASGCVSANIGLDSNDTANSSAVLVPFQEAEYAMRGRAYFHIRAGPESKTLLYPTRAEVFVGPNEEPKCAVGVQSG